MAARGATNAYPVDPEALRRTRARLQAARARDFTYASGRILGSMCTAPHPLAVEAHRLFLEANLGDPGHFPGAKDLEEDYVQKLLRICGATARSGAGQVTSGGSEANILALALMRETTGRDEVIVPRTGHFSFEKAAKFMKMRLRIADVDEHYRVRPEAVDALVGPRTAGIIGIAGSTQLGSLDPIPSLGRLAQAHGVPLHVDAAFGGYLLPFRRPSFSFGFDVPGVTSVTIDSHKMGMGTLGAGALLVRDPAALEALAVETPYLSVPRQRGVLGTRSAAPVAAAWALLDALGQRGYARVVAACLKNTSHFVARLRAEHLAPLIQPELNIVAVPCLDPQRVQDDLTRHHWRVNVLPRLGAIRIICMPHVTREGLDEFLPDLVRVLGSKRGGARSLAAPPVAFAR